MHFQKIENNENALAIRSDLITASDYLTFKIQQRSIFDYEYVLIPPASVTNLKMPSLSLLGRMFEQYFESAFMHR